MARTYHDLSFDFDDEPRRGARPADDERTWMNDELDWLDEDWGEDEWKAGAADDDQDDQDDWTPPRRA